jgi:hypothetical protein
MCYSGKKLKTRNRSLDNKMIMQLGFDPENQKWCLFTNELREGLVVHDSDDDMDTLIRRNGMFNESKESDESND